MHFRVRRNVVQLVRTTYDPEAKRPKAQVVGRIPMADPMLSDELRGLLTTEEIAEAEAWIALEFRKVLLREELAALSLAESLEQAHAWFQRQGGAPLAAEMAAAVLPNLTALRKTLRGMVE